MATNSKTLACLKLCSKELYYTDPGDDRTAEEEIKRLFATPDTAMYWCDGTLTGRGPDGQPANKEACSCSKRQCYVGLTDLA